MTPPPKVMRPIGAQILLLAPVPCLALILLIVRSLT